LRYHRHHLPYLLLPLCQLLYHLHHQQTNRLHHQHRYRHHRRRRL
jgi:hypothetical protein